MSRFGVTIRFVAALLAAQTLSLFCTALLDTGWAVAGICSSLVLLATLLDFVLTPGRQWFQVKRVFVPFEQGRPGAVDLILTKAFDPPVCIRITDTPPDSLQGGRTITAYTMEERELIHTYTLSPTLRGVFPFGDCYLEIRGRWGLSVRRFALPCADNAVVYPNLAPMRHYRMLAERNQLSRENTALHRIRGIGTEFNGLKEYETGDDWRKVNWKASARAGKLMTNIYDLEKDREVVLVVDTGRWMRASIGGVTRLDRALELTAALMQVALSSGDRVGLVLFDTEVTTYLPPGKGAAHAGRLLQALYSARESDNAPDLSCVSDLLRFKLAKRAFICMLTYLDNTAEAGQAIRDLAPIRRRHALYLASLTDTGLENLITKNAAATSDVYLKAAAAYRKTSVLSAVEFLRRNGISAHAAEPGELLNHSVLQYLSVKRLPM